MPNFIFNIQMSVYSKAIEEFQALNSQLKKEKLLSLLRKFETLDEIFVKLINSVSSKNYTDRILVWIYKVLVSSLENWANDYKSDWMNSRAILGIRKY